MRDTVSLEKRGVPSVALVHDRFEAAAKSQAKILNLISVKLVAIPEPHPGEAESEMSARIDSFWDEIIGALVRPKLKLHQQPSKPKDKSKGGRIK
jgi:hypothetical protein